MGAGRKLVDLLNNYQQLSTFSPSYEAPTLSDSTMRTWSSRYNWANRASEYDKTWEQRKNEERAHVFDMALALDYGRVQKLIQLANLLESQIYERSIDGELHNVWLPDVKQIGSGDFAERVDIERFNASLISEYRSTLDDIAKEVGGRVKKQEHSGKDGGAIETVNTNVNTHSVEDAQGVLNILENLGVLPHGTSRTIDTGDNSETE